MWFVCLGLWGCGATPASTAPTVVQSAQDLQKLSDEFDGNALNGWKRVFQTEGWGADQLEKLSVTGGELMMMPRTSTWYMDYRAELTYKDVTGDFMVTTKVAVTGRNGQSAPRSSYSLGGLMIRAPRRDSASNWRPGGENYVFLSLGSADQLGEFQFEVKTTQNSNSELEKTSAPSGQARLRILRLGANIVAMSDAGDGWKVQKRYQRSDMPETLQVGMTVYTDYESASRLSPVQHNGTAISSGNPDLIAKFDYVRFAKPIVPAGMNLSQSTDAEIVAVFGKD